MKKQFIYLLLFSILLFSIIAGCQNPAGDSGGGGDSDNEKSIYIKQLGWYIENIDTTFWNGSSPNAHCFYDFFIYYDGDISLNDIEYARVYKDTLFWSIPLTSNYFDSTNKVIGGWYRCFDNNNGNVLPIGNLRAEVKLKNGKIASFIKSIPSPGSTTTNGYNYVYTSEDYATGLSDYTSMIKRAVIRAKTINTITENIMINFNINNDNNVYNGLVFFYDNNNEFVANSKSFRDQNNGNLTSIINSGISLNTNGDNLITISNTDLSFASGKSFNDISKFIVVLTDGAQYALRVDIMLMTADRYQ